MISDVHVHMTKRKPPEKEAKTLIPPRPETGMGYSA